MSVAYGLHLLSTYVVAPCLFKLCRVRHSWDAGLALQSDYYLHIRLLKVACQPANMWSGLFVLSCWRPIAYVLIVAHKLFFCSMFDNGLTDSSSFIWAYFGSKGEWNPGMESLP